MPFEGQEHSSFSKGAAIDVAGLVGKCDGSTKLIEGV